MKFNNNDGTKILGKGTFKISNKKNRLEEVLFMVGLEHNLLSTSQISNTGHDMIFKKWGCEFI